MRVNDQGFTERLSGSTSSRVEDANLSGSNSPSSAKQAGSASPDKLQLSSLASQLQSLGSNDPDRAARISQIAQAVSGKTYQVSAAKVSQAIVSEAIQYAA